MNVFERIMTGFREYCDIRMCNGEILLNILRKPPAGHCLREVRSFANQLK